MLPHHDRANGPPVRLTVVDNEASARMAEQLLLLEGIPAFSRCLGAGPALSGTAFNLPHALYVRPADAPRAREVLDLPPLELVERGALPAPPPRRRRWWLVALAVLLAALLTVTAGPLAARLYG